MDFNIPEYYARIRLIFSAYSEAFSEEDGDHDDFYKERNAFINGALNECYGVLYQKGFRGDSGTFLTGFWEEALCKKLDPEIEVWEFKKSKQSHFSSFTMGEKCMEMWMQGQRDLADCIGQLISDKKQAALERSKQAALEQSRRENKLCIKCGGSLGFWGKFKKAEICKSCGEGG